MMKRVSIFISVFCIAFNIAIAQEYLKTTPFSVFNYSFMGGINFDNENIFIQKSVQSAIWNAENKIIFIWFLGYYQDNGTIWIINEDGYDKKQITYNYGLVLEGGG